MCAPFDVFGGTQYERLVRRVHGKAAVELEFTYNVCALLQAVHNRVLGAGLQVESNDTPDCLFDLINRVAPHKLFVLTSAGYKLLDLSITDSTQSATLHAVVNRHNHRDQNRPAYDFLAGLSHSAVDDLRWFSELETEPGVGRALW